jgi:hypothetical protein
MEPGSTPAVTISELEAALAEIGAVRAARIVASAQGRIEEIHVLGLPGKSPKQLVRDIESCLMAGYGVAVDRRVISVAQIGIAGETPPVADVSELREFSHKRATDPEPEPQAGRERESEPEPEAAVSSRVRIAGVDTDSDSLRTTVRVRLESDGLEVTGESSGPAGTSTQQRMVAEATLRAVDQLPCVTRSYAVGDCSIMLLGGRQVVLCSIVTVTPEGEEALSGSALVRHTSESATVRATLDALNRRIGL